MKDVLIFYAGQLVFEIPKEELNALARSMCHGNYEFYSGAYVYVPTNLLRERQWFRMDMTPVLPADVPSELKLTLLLLN